MGSFKCNAALMRIPLIVDMSDLTGQSMLNDICLGGCGNERRATLSAKTITCVGARTENWQRT